MSRGPNPSRLHLLSSLPSLPIGAKVRFLGWYVERCFGIAVAVITDQNVSVTSYALETGTLFLVHRYPKSSQVKAAVDINLLLETITSENLRTGELVNVIGYITAKDTLKSRDRSHEQFAQVSVQALLLWSAGPLDLQRYEQALTVIQKSPPNSGVD